MSTSPAATSESAIAIRHMLDRAIEGYKTRLKDEGKWEGNLEIKKGFYEHLAKAVTNELARTGFNGITLKGTTLTKKLEQNADQKWERRRATALAAVLRVDFGSVFSETPPETAVPEAQSQLNRVLASLEGPWLECIHAKGDKLRFSISWFKIRENVWQFYGFPFSTDGLPRKRWTAYTMALHDNQICYSYGQESNYPGFGIVNLSPSNMEGWDAVSGHFIDVTVASKRKPDGGDYEEINAKFHYTVMYRLADGLSRAGGNLEDYGDPDTWRQPADAKKVIEFLIKSSHQWDVTEVPESLRPRGNSKSTRRRKTDTEAR